MDAAEADLMARHRAQMVEYQLRRGGIDDVQILAAMGRVPREAFVDERDPARVYGDHPLAIDQGQTISQPYIVALMSAQLFAQPHHRLLEVGTGCGYQTAVLARLVDRVYTVERIEGLCRTAKTTLRSLEINNVQYHCGDGTLGWPQRAPFDRIMVTAGAPDVPETLREQLSEGGRMIIPIGQRERQMLVAVERHGNQFARTDLCPCVFVSLIGTQGWPDDPSQT